MRLFARHPIQQEQLLIIKHLQACLKKVTKSGNSRPGSPCPGLQQPNFIIIVLLLSFLLVGGRGTETTVLLWYARLFTPLHRSTFGRLPEQEGEGTGCFLLAGGRGAETTVLLFRYSFWLLLFGGIYESGRGRLPSAALSVCSLLFAVCCFSLLFQSVVFSLLYSVCCSQSAFYIFFFTVLYRDLLPYVVDVDVAHCA